MRLFTLTSAMAALLLASPPAHAQQPGPTTSAGPGRITCKSAAVCVVGIGDPATIKYQVDTAALPEADKDRLSKQCKPNGKNPCVVTIVGTENGDPLKVKAAKITWYN
jgi:hypothetical protein